MLHARRHADDALPEQAPEITAPSPIVAEVGEECQGLALSPKFLLAESTRRC